jgi:hypothetical protein
MGSLVRRKLQTTFEHYLSGACEVCAYNYTKYA